MKRFAASLILLIVFAVSLAFPQTWLKGSLDDARAKAKAAGKPLLIDFFAETG